MSNTGLTKARSMGPVAELVRAAGGSVARVFQRAELPLSIVEEPERLILLSDQLRVLQCAAREIGDDALGARLSTHAGFSALGEYGRRIEASTTLGEAFKRACVGMGSMLQASTLLQLEVRNGWAHCSYRITESVEIGRQQNEMLALGYLLDLLRRFAGRNAIPARLELAGSRPASLRRIEDVYDCELTLGQSTALIFPAELLDVSRPVRNELAPPAGPEVPAADDIVACVEHLIGLALLEQRPGIDWIGRRIGVSRRTLQRLLRARGEVYELVLQRCALRRARELLRSGYSVTDTALALGYTDSAHFSRAYRRWTGRTPRSDRQRALADHASHPANGHEPRLLNG